MYDYLIVGSGLSGATFARTVVTREYPVPFSAGSGSAAAPYYPVATPHNAAIADRYRALAAELADVTFIGRLAEYRYYDMDDVIAAAMIAYNLYHETKR